VTVDFDLQQVIEPFGRSYSRAAQWDVILGWIESGKVELEVFAPKLLLPAGWTQNEWGNNDHSRMCEMMATYLREVLDIPCTTGGNQKLLYRGGIADVGAMDGSVFVECGTLREDKLQLAMRAGERLIILPYGSGQLVESSLRPQLHCEEEVRRLRERVSPTNEYISDMADATVQLAFMFNPIGEVEQEDVTGPRNPIRRMI